MRKKQRGFPPNIFGELSKERIQNTSEDQTKIFFFIQNEDKKNEKMFTIDEEEITSFSQIGSKTRLKPIDFFNQISKKQKHFLEFNTQLIGFPLK